MAHEWQKSLFRGACDRGDVADELKAEHPTKGSSAIQRDDDTESELAFVAACRHGPVSFAKHVWAQGVQFRNVDLNYAFGVACEYGHLEIAQWLLSLGELIGISAFEY